MIGIFRSFKCAFNGIVSAVKTQRNMRIHIIAIIYVTAFSLFYDFSNFQYTILILIFLIVVSLELINTAIESVVDICSPQYSKLAKMAKDCAAGAVLVSAIGAVVIGVLLFADITVLKKIIDYYQSHIIALGGFVVSCILAILFVINPFNNAKGK